MYQEDQEPQLCLASGSPRRHQLLAGLGVRFTTVIPDVDERVPGQESPESYVRRLASLKARAGMLLCDDRVPVLGADTTVVTDGKILGKPSDRHEAADMLRLLSDRWHQVLSAVTIVHRGREEAALSVTRVRFRKISGSEIDAYWSGGEPVDKAGGYAIQGRGALFVESIEGSYSGVVGLPLYETGRLLALFGIKTELLLGDMQQ